MDNVDRTKSFLYSRDYSIDPRNRPHPTSRTNLCTIFDGSSTESISSTKSDDTASVFLRVRPIVNTGQYMIENNVFKIFNSEQSVEKQFTFSDVFPCDVLQRQVYNTCVQTAVDNDDNLTLLMYGTSGSGKTYTLMGDADQPGIIPRAVEHIFSRHGGSISTVPNFKAVGADYTLLPDDEIEKEFEKRKLYFNSSNGIGSIFSGDKEKIQSEHDFIELQPNDTNVYIWISFLEIYNENIHDLLEIPSTNSMKKRRCLKVMSNSGRTFVKDLTSIFTINSDEASKLLTMGLNYRLNAATNINDNSSRSHCIFLVDVIKYEKSNGISHNCYKFCDLAGSERVKKSETTGSRLKEAQNINTSLLVLGRCLDTAFNNQGKKKPDLVPFRESKLTLYLQSALSGKEKLTMIANIWPTSDFCEENMHVLNYASMAQKIVYRQPTVKRTSISRRFSFFLGPQSDNVQTYDPNISIILDENYRLKQKIEDLEDANEELREEADELFHEKVQLEEKLVIMHRMSETLEQKVRNEVVDDWMQELRKKEESVEARMQIRINFLMRTHAEEVEELKARIRRRDDELDELYEEIDVLKGRADTSNPKDDKEPNLTITIDD